ncbi:MAG: hypothetical protein HYS80_00780 [Candidatus Aenigmarchaeota archaeon]|nr:hypothetical protein [Candidatus Aenigmarchaeota archaeon]
MVDLPEREPRVSILVRKVRYGERRIRAGIYHEQDRPAQEIVTGNRYLAKMDGYYVAVIAQKNQTMELALPDWDPMKDPRTVATEAAIREASRTRVYRNVPK